MWWEVVNPNAQMMTIGTSITKNSSIYVMAITPSLLPMAWPPQYWLTILAPTNVGWASSQNLLIGSAVKKYMPEWSNGCLLLKIS